MPSGLPDPVVRDLASVQRNFEKLRAILRTLVISVNGKKPVDGKVTLVPGDIAGVLSTTTTFGGDVTGTYGSLSLVATGVTANNSATTAYNRFRVDSKGRITYANNGLEVNYLELTATTQPGGTSGNPLTQDHAFVEVSAPV